MKNPIIGVIPLWDEQRDSIWMLPGYLEGVRLAGGLPIVLPLTTDESLLEQTCEIVDGLLFTGGQDVNPGLYGEEISAVCSEICSARDNMEGFLFSHAVLGMDKPAFGICRGIQLFNALLGGTLYQDLPSQYKGSRPICHPQTYELFPHSVTIETGSLLQELLNVDTMAVNSAHHQGVATLSQKLTCMAKADDGLIEAVYMPSKKFVWAVQWHPECSLHAETSRNLFEVFVKACV